MVRKVAKPEKGGTLQEEYASKEEFYEHYLLEHGWGSLDHTNAPGGWDTAFTRIRSESDSPADQTLWSLTFVAPYSVIHNLGNLGTSLNQTPVPGVVSATARTGRVRVLLDAEDLRFAFAVIRAFEVLPRREDEFTLEELTTAVRAPYSY